MKDEILSPGDALTDEAIVQIITNKLPAWKTACEHADADHVIFDQLAFGNTTDELLLMAIAIKYAKLKGKGVMISC